MSIMDRGEYSGINAFLGKIRKYICLEVVISVPLADILP